MITRTFNAESFLLMILPYLKLSDIPNISQVNRKFGSTVKTLFSSERFRKSTSIEGFFTESLKNDACSILMNPQIVYAENSPALMAAFKSLREGKLDPEAIKALNTEQLNYKNPDLSDSLQTIRGAGQIISDFTPNPLMPFQTASKLDEIIVLLTLLFTALIVAVNVINEGTSYCVNRCRARKQHEKLKQRVMLFNDLAEAKPQPAAKRTAASHKVKTP